MWGIATPYVLNKKLKYISSTRYFYKDKFGAWFWLKVDFILKIVAEMYFLQLYTYLPMWNPKYLLYLLSRIDVPPRLNECIFFAVFKNLKNVATLISRFWRNHSIGFDIIISSMKNCCCFFQFFLCFFRKYELRWAGDKGPSI